MTLKQVKMLFLVAAIYDIALGIGFALLFKPIYKLFSIELPNHDGYVQLTGLFVLTFGIGFYLVFRDPIQNRALILTGILMKLAFVVVAFGHLIFGTIPNLYVVFASCDAVFLVLFAISGASLSRQEV